MYTASVFFAKQNTNIKANKPPASFVAKYAATARPSATPAAKAICPPNTNAPDTVNAAFIILPLASIRGYSGSMETLETRLVKSPKTAYSLTPSLDAAHSSHRLHFASTSLPATREPHTIMVIFRMITSTSSTTSGGITDRSGTNRPHVIQQNNRCTYTTSSGSETETVENEDGTTTTTTTTYLYVNVTLKSCYTMANEYGFTQEQMDLLVDFMSPENLAILGYSPGGGGGDPGVCSLTEAEIQAVLDDIPDGAAKDACDFALHRVGYPYSQELRHSGTHFDCSSLVYYAWLDAGVDISYGGATTAGYEAQGLANAGKTTVYEDMQPGDLIFFSYEETDGYLDISNVGIYVGNGKMVDARGTAYGVVYRDVPPNTGAIVMIGRPN